MNITLDAVTIPLLIGGIITVLGAATTAVLTVISAWRQKTIITAVQHNTEVTEQGQAASKERSDAIHVLVNNNTDKLKERIAQLEALLLAANEALADLRLIHRADANSAP